MRLAEQDLRTKFRKFRYRQRNYLNAIEQEASRQRWDVFCFGGVPRGGMFSEHYKPRDLDLVFSDDSFGRFAHTFKKEIVKENRFGGLKLEIAGIEVDAWPISSTWAFKSGHIPDVCFENLPKTTFFNIDGIVAELVSSGHARRVFEHGYRDAVSRKTLEINLFQNPFPQLCAIRALRLAQNYDLWWSGDLAHYVHTIVTQSKIRDLLKFENDHYGETIFTRNTYTSLTKHLEYHFSNFDEAETPVFQAELFLKRDSTT